MPMAKPVSQLTTRRSAVTERRFQRCRLLVVFTEGRDLCSFVGQGELCLKYVRSGEQGDLVSGQSLLACRSRRSYRAALDHVISQMVDELQPQCTGDDSGRGERRVCVLCGTRRRLESSYLVDPASSHMLVSKIKPCMSKYKQICTVKLRMAH